MRTKCVGDMPLKKPSQANEEKLVKPEALGPFIGNKEHVSTVGNSTVHCVWNSKVNIFYRYTGFD